MIVTIIGINIANQIPFNIQNAVGNIFELLGQVIITFNAQQQYFQGGPGRYYNPIYRNSSNPFCETTTDEGGKNTSGNASSKSTSNKNVKSKSQESSNSNKSSKSIENRIDKLEKEIGELKEMIERLK